MSIQVEEQETIINFSRSDNSAVIWTSDSTIITKLDKLVKAAPKYYSLRNTGVINDSIVNKEYFVADKSLISFRSGKVKREMSEEQKKALAERLKQSRQA